MTSSFFFVLLTAALVLLVITRLATDRLVHHHHAQKVDFFYHYPIQPGDIVFLGDSITDGARWDELFPGRPVKNRGINADTPAGVLERLDPILSGSPRAIFLLIGTNDLPWYTYRNDTDILHTYRQILESCQAGSPQTQIFVQSILPRHQRFSRRIQRLNAGIKELAEHFGYSYIDLYSHFVGDKGELRAEFHNDHLHLLGSGYVLWVEILTPYMESL